MDARARTVLRRVPYGVHALTVRHEGEEHAATVTWAMQTSFEPPMLAVAMETVSRTIELVRDARHFVLNLLHHDQRELAAKLGRPSATTPGKLKGIKTKPAPRSGAPILSDVLGWLECRVVATLPSGDHTVVLGEVLEAGVEREDGVPLTLDAAGLEYSA